MSEAKKQSATAGVPAPRRVFRRSTKIAAAALLAFVLFVERSEAGDREREERGLWFVHFTDPHLFLKPKDEGKEERERQNKEALSDMLESIRSLPGNGEPPALLVFTGDLGIDPCEIATDRTSTKTCLETADKAKRAEQIRVTAETLGKSPVRDIYLVAGNNDIANESAGDEALGYFNQFIDDVQAKLDSTKVQLHNLTRGYSSTQPAATCYADIPHTDYRLIGFPSYSFKPLAAGQEKKDAEQEKHVAIFRGLVDGARDKKVLVLSHTPGIEDPYALAQARFSKATPSAASSPTPSPRSSPRTSPGSSPTPSPASSPTPSPASSPTASPSPASGSSATPSPSPAASGTPAATNTPAAEPKPAKSLDASTWKVSEKVLKSWNDAIALNSVIAVLAGDLHDSHKEIYEPPYAWSNSSEHRSSFPKLFLAPPLAVKNQDTSPIQARGFSLVHLKHDRLESRLFWYDSETRKFAPEPRPHHHRQHAGFWKGCGVRLCGAIKWLWNLDGKDDPLVRMAVLLIAFLTAFLTIVAIWQIPATKDPFEDKKTENASKPGDEASKANTDGLPFSSRFGKTVVAGLAGLIAAEVTKSLGNQQPSPETRWFYIVWFILFFFILLLSLNLWRAFVEALRSRVAVVYYPLKSQDGWTNFRHWLASLRVPLLTFCDTFVNLIQGKNQTRTAVFEKRIIDQQKTIIDVADAIREHLNRLIDERVRAKAKDDELEHVRVNISVLSKDQSRLFYIAKADNSSHSTFPKHSIAWASVFTGQALWYLSSYKEPQTDFKRIILFANEGTVPDEKGPYTLQSYYQGRPQEDYQAFIILPIPSPRRAFTSYVKGGIQISFLKDADFELIWKADLMKPRPTPDGGPPVFPVLQPVTKGLCLDDDIRLALTTAIAALGQLLRGFNEIIYENYIEDKKLD